MLREERQRRQRDSGSQSMVPENIGLCIHRLEEREDRGTLGFFLQPDGSVSEIVDDRLPERFDRCESYNPRETVGVEIENRMSGKRVVNLFAPTNAQDMNTYDVDTLLVAAARRLIGFGVNRDRGCGLWASNSAIFDLIGKPSGVTIGDVAGYDIDGLREHYVDDEE